MNTSKYLLALLLSLSGFVGLAHGSSVYYLNENNIGLVGTNAWATVEISYSTIDSADIYFQVMLNHDEFSYDSDSNFGMQDFFFNYNTTTGLNFSEMKINIIDQDGWTLLSEKEYNAGGGYGKYGIEYFGSGSTRAMSLSFTISGVDDDTLLTYALDNAEGHKFATHIAGFDDIGDGTTSGKFSTSVLVTPLPASVWLLGSALVGFVGFARRRSI